MPKIGNFSAMVTANSIYHNIEYTVMYTQKLHFYVFVPDGYIQALELLDKETKKKYNVTVSGRGTPKPIVTSETEAKVHELFKDLLRILVEQTKTSRPVIVVYFSTQKDRYGKSDGIEFPKNGFTISMNYCTEMKVGNSEPKYYIFTTRDFNGRMETTRKEVRVTGSYERSIVIDDTPENRTFLERIYGALNELHDKVQSLTSSPENLLSFIASKQLLIN